MSNVRRIFLFAVTLFVFATAQYAVGQPLCHDGGCSWSGPFNNAYDVSGCIVQLTWYFRICNGVQEFQVTAIKRFNMCTVEGWELFAGAEIALLEDNPMDFEPDEEGECVSNVRASRASCFRPDGASGDLVICDDYNCCRIPYRVCMVGDERVAEQVGTPEVAVNNCDYTLAGCRFVCPPH